LAKLNRKYLQIYPLGGVGEIGKNMYVFEYDRDIIVIDAGLKYPEEDMLGIDIVIPDMTYLEENKDRIRGIILTHGHEDHFGALPYLMKMIKAPIYGTKLTLGLLEPKLEEANILQQTKLRTIHSRSEIKLGQFKVSFFKTDHSIPDSVGVCVDTPEGRIVHTGDFKFDYSPINGEATDLTRIAQMGEQGVLALLSDSTNAERKGYTRSEKDVGRAIKDQFHKAKGRIVVAALSSNIHRIQNVVDAARDHRRKVVLVGERMINSASIAMKLGYLHVPDNLLIDVAQMNKLAPEQIVILTTGSQGEPMSDLTRMAKSSHKEVEIMSGDTVIFAATPLPGNEKFVSRTIDQLYRAGAHVVYDLEGVHVSGHGSQEELKLMLNLINPTYFIPIHGEYRMLRVHGKLAEQVGVDPDNVFLIENGDVVEFSQGKARLGGKLPSGNVLIDGLGVGDVGNIVLRDRKLLSQDGILIVVVTLSKENGRVLSGPDIISRGFVYVRESEALLDESIRIINGTLQQCLEEGVHDWSVIKTSVRDKISRYLYEQTRRRPMILPIIMEA
jgi:ribonuclease J